MAVQLPIEGRGFLCGDATRAAKLIGTVVLGDDAQWYQITEIKTRRNPISIDYIGYGKVVSEKTAVAILRVMAAKKALQEAKAQIKELSLQPHRANELAAAKEAKAAAEAILAAAGKRAEKIQADVNYTPNQYVWMRQYV